MKKRKVNGFFMGWFLVCHPLIEGRAESPKDDLIVTVPEVNDRGSSDIPEARPGEGAFTAPKISLSPETLILPDSILPPTENRSFVELMERAAANLASNQVYEATRYFWRAGRRMPEDQEALAGLAASFLLAEDAERARQIYTYLVERYPTEEEYRFNLASCCYKLGKFDQADVILTRLAEIHPGDAKILYNSGLNKVAAGEKDAGMAQLEKSFEILPENPFPMLALARIHSREGEKQLMIERLLRAAKLLSPAELQFYLADPAFNAWKNDDLFTRILRGSF